MKKVDSRIQDIRMQGQSMSARLYMYKVHITSLYMYVGRFARVSMEAVAHYELAAHLESPMADCPSVLFHHARCAGVRAAVRDLRRKS